MGTGLSKETVDSTYLEGLAGIWNFIDTVNIPLTITVWKTDDEHVKTTYVSEFVLENNKLVRVWKEEKKIIDAGKKDTVLIKADEVETILKQANGIAVLFQIDVSNKRFVNDFKNNKGMETLNILEQMKTGPDFQNNKKGISLYGYVDCDTEEGCRTIELTVESFSELEEKQTGGGSKSTKVHILGRLRVVTQVGTRKLITYKGQQICMTEARALEKKLRKKSRAAKN